MLSTHLFSFDLVSLDLYKGYRAIPTSVRCGREDVHELQVRHDVLGSGCGNLRLHAAEHVWTRLQQHGGERLTRLRDMQSS